MSVVNRGQKHINFLLKKKDLPLVNGIRSSLHLIAMVGLIANSP